MFAFEAQFRDFDDFGAVARERPHKRRAEIERMNKQPPQTKKSRKELLGIRAELKCLVGLLVCLLPVGVGVFLFTRVRL